MTDPAAASAPTVIVVDDDASVRAALSRLLRSSGWTVRTFACAEELLSQEGDLIVGCLLADVHLGRMSGIELKAALDSRGSTVPVILTSGVDDAELEAQSRQVGALAFFRKPFDIEALLDVIDATMSRWPARPLRSTP